MSSFDQLSHYHFDLPDELIAQYPASPRHSSKLLHVDRLSGQMEILPFYELGHHLGPKDLLIFNNTRVIPARLAIQRATGGIAELFALEVHADRWRVMLRPSSRMKRGKLLLAPGGVTIEPIELEGEGIWWVKLQGLQVDPLKYLEQFGRMPLPPYIRKGEAQASDKEDYQTKLARYPGSVAAPTAGLHFSHELLSDLHARGVGHGEVTLHVGLGTFQPVRHEDLSLHKMHEESFEIPSSLLHQLSEAPQKGIRRISVGSTTLRALESYSPSLSGVQKTNIFIRPGYQFQRVDSLITNFHLPESTLLMLTCAFGGYDLIMKAYRLAVQQRLRFFSYGDAMWIT